MGCSGCKKKTYKEYSKKIHNRTSIGVITIVIFLGLAGYGLWSLINNIL